MRHRISRARLTAATAAAVALLAGSLTLADANAATGAPEAKTLKSVKADLTDSAVSGTSRAIDKTTGKVVVTADRTVKGEALAKLKKQVAAQDGKAVLKRTAGKFEMFIAGGDAIYTGGSRCSLGFNVTKGGQPYFLTAGHCVELGGTDWSESSGGPVIGTSEAATFPGNDRALIKYTGDTAHPSAVNLYNGSTQEITGARAAVVGETVQRSGSTTQVHDGTVKALDVSVTYPQGTVNGLIQTDVCAEPGDSGGALFAGGDALGLTSGGSGNCSSGGETFFEPVVAALEEYGATIP
ncbi:S1 family peptidase [Streptomyces sp. A7024]|uniref:S1 family peptidase n=1 Tax=Streptomyces coryli TaxID=1128680 RepID=A0A6G4TWZ5_9ACTN|nr:S1 family peptidase [Streptomyces coryli]NGN63966.1 S1 family peptidase [Streptomyces coryli]